MEKEKKKYISPLKSNQLHSYLTFSSSFSYLFDLGTHLIIYPHLTFPTSSCLYDNDIAIGM